MHPRTSPLPPVELTDPLWTIEHLARALRLGERATRTAITDPAFPAPFRLTAYPTARLYWVREHLLAHLARATAPSAAAPRAAEVPAAPAASSASTRPPRLRPAAATRHPAPPAPSTPGRSTPAPVPASDPAAAAWAAIYALPTTGGRAR